MQYGWPILALCVAALAIFEAVNDGAGWLMIFLVPAAAVGFALGRRASIGSLTSGLRDPGATGIAIAVGLGLAMAVVPRFVLVAGPIGAIIVPSVGFLGAGYLIAVATRRDLREAIEGS